MNEEIKKIFTEKYHEKMERIQEAIQDAETSPSQLEAILERDLLTYVYEMSIKDWNYSDIYETIFGVMITIMLKYLVEMDVPFHIVKTTFSHKQLFEVFHQLRTAKQKKERLQQQLKEFLEDEE